MSLILISLMHVHGRRIHKSALLYRLHVDVLHRKLYDGKEEKNEPFALGTHGKCIGHTTTSTANMLQNLIENCIYAKIYDVSTGFHHQI